MLNLTIQSLEVFDQWRQLEVVPVERHDAFPDNDDIRLWLTRY